MNREPTDAEKVAAVKRALREMNEREHLGELHEHLRQGLASQVGQFVTPAARALIKAKAKTRLRELVQGGKILDYHNLEVVESAPGELTVNVDLEMPVSANARWFKS